MAYSENVPYGEYVDFVERLIAHMPGTGFDLRYYTDGQDSELHPPSALLDLALRAEGDPAGWICAILEDGKSEVIFDATRIDEFGGSFMVEWVRKVLFPEAA